MTKNTLLYIAAFAASIAVTANKLAGDAPAEETPDGATPEPTPTKRRGRPPGATEPGATTSPTAEPAKEAVAGVKTEAELREMIKVPVGGGKGQKLKDFLTAHGAANLSALAPEHHAAFTAEMKKLTAEVEAEQM